MTPLHLLLSALDAGHFVSMQKLNDGYQICVIVRSEGAVVRVAEFTDEQFDQALGQLRPMLPMDDHEAEMK